jgi:chorismate mutase
MWEMAIQLKTLCPELPIINDPSHICGNRELIPYISQKALDLDMQGLMIESHVDPSVAWTDAKQQVTPAALAELVERLTVREPEAPNEAFADKLADLRKNIDKIDDILLQKLAERMAIVEKIGEFKRDNQVTILQVNRWDSIIKKGHAFAKALKLDLNFTEKFLELVHGESIRKQTEIMNAGKAEKGIAAEQHTEVKA